VGGCAGVLRPLFPPGLTDLLRCKDLERPISTGLDYGGAARSSGEIRVWGGGGRVEVRSGSWGRLRWGCAREL
jgi:hypothetical protein